MHVQCDELFANISYCSVESVPVFFKGIYSTNLKDVVDSVADRMQVLQPQKYVEDLLDTFSHLRRDISVINS